MTVGGHEVPAGATLGTSITLIHRRADLYPEPLAFRPERFLEAKPETYTWIPFGGGVRRCLGALVRDLRDAPGAERGPRPPRAARAGPAPRAIRRRGITFVPGRGAQSSPSPL